MTKLIPQWNFRANRPISDGKTHVADPQSKESFLTSLELDSQMGLDWIDKITKAEITDKSFYNDQPLSQQLIEATGLNPKSLNIDWNKPGDAFEPKLPLLKIRQITDASGDGSLAEVFEDGALRINFSSEGWSDYFNEIHVSDRVQRVNHDPSVSASVTAKDLETGEIIDLGTQRVNPNQGSFLVNLKDKLNAVSTGSLRDHYSIEVNFSGGHDNRPLDSFSEAITLIKPMQYGANHLGDETSNKFNYSDIGSAIGSARVYKGRGGTDFLNLEGIRSTDVLSFNGRAGIDTATASELGRQAFYGGSVFDTLSLKNGDELYLQGMERLRFSDVTIDLTPNLDATSDRQWNTQVMDVNGAWRFNTGSDDVVLVSLDSGLKDDGTGQPVVHGEIDHVRYLTGVNNYNSNHGHQAMSVMAAEHDGSNVAGIAPSSQLWGLNIKPSGQAGVGLLQGLQTVANQRQSHQRMVFQGGIQGDWPWTANGATEAEVETALGSSNDWGFFSIAAGNGGPGASNFTDPNYLTSVSGVAQAAERWDHIASVGALQSTGWEEEPLTGLLNTTGTQLASYSNRGSNLTLVAPTDSWAIDGDGNLSSFGGTSAANPNLAGVAALVWSENANIDGGELREILIGSAMDLGAGGFDNTFGFGLVNAESAMRRAHALYQNEELASFWANNEFMA